MTETDYRPSGWSPKDVPTIWVDQTTGQGVSQDGTTVKPIIRESRKNPNLTDLLDTAASYGAGRIMLTGKRPEPAPGIRHWLFVQTPNWIPGDHWINNGPPAGRFNHAVTGHRVEVRTVEEWFGDAPLTPAQARLAWEATASVLRSVDDRARLMLSPAATGTNLWAWSLPKNVNPVQVSPDIAEELHLTSGQHHLEHLVAGPNFSKHDDCVPLVNAEATKRISSFSYVDGRFMYAALGREIGIGPGIRLNRAGAYQLLQDDPYTRARFLVRFTVPKDWNHVGILGVRHQNVSDGWYYPNRPGATADTWADSAEVAVALRAGWLVEPMEAIRFRDMVMGSKQDGTKGMVKARPLDTLFDRMIRARERVADNPELAPMLRLAVMFALRAIVLHTIGSFASAGRDQTKVVESALDVPPEYQSTVQRQGKLFVYRVPSRISERNRLFYHPEFASQIWGRARARVLSAPSALGNSTAGALTVDPATLIGINGDAIYTTELPTWSLPVEHGGGDDGKTGRLRLQGFLTGSITTPATLQARDQLRARADKAGPAAAWTKDAS